MSSFPVLILLLLVIAFLFRVDFIYYVIYVLLGVYGLSRWLIPRSFKKILIVRRFAPNAFIGDMVEVRVEAKNISRLPVAWLELRESIPVGFKRGEGLSEVVSLKGNDQQHFTYHIQAIKRGYYRLGPLTISMGDLFGFTQIDAKKDAEYLTVYPRIISLRKLGLQSNLPFGTIQSKQKIFEDPARPFGVREFQIGDSTKYINWKASAKQRKLLVRTHQPAISLETFILLNLNKEEYARKQRYDSSEWAVVVAASIAAHLSEQRQSVGLAVNGLDPLQRFNGGSDFDDLFDQESGRLEIPAELLKAIENSDPGQLARLSVPESIAPRRGRAHLMKVLEVLARVESGSTFPFKHWVTNKTVDLSWGTTILIISPHGDSELCYAIHSLVKKGFNPILIIIQPYTDFRTVALRAQSLGFKASLIPSAKELNFWWESPAVIPS